MTLPFDSSSLSSAEKDALIATLLARIDELSKRLDALEKENAELRAKLKLPPKTRARRRRVGRRAARPIFNTWSVRTLQKPA